MIRKQLSHLFLYSIFILSSSFFPTLSIAQDEAQSEKGIFYPADSFRKCRFYTAYGAGAIAYTGTVIGLSDVWYSQFDRSKFHFYNDWGIWRNIDKLGHAYTAYLYTDLIYDINKWVGMKDRKSLWMAAGAASLFQLTIEVLDGYSERWGFSPWDIASNTAGSAFFVVQHLLWQEQRIRLKYSAFPQSYSTAVIPSLNNKGTMTYQERVEELYGKGIASRIIKDYNGQTYWLSVNLASFGVPHPEWLNWAVGIGASDLYDGDNNKWISDGINYYAPFPQRTVFYLSPDINWSAFKGENAFLNTILDLLNYLKAPLPAVSVDTQGNIGWYLVFF